MKVKEIMHSITNVPPDISISKAAEIMDKKSIGSVLIEEKGKIIGIMTERDILRKIVAKGKNPNQTRVREIMSSPLITIDADEDVLKAGEIMDKKRIRRLVVTENGKIVGKVTANSIARNIQYMSIQKITSVRNDYPRPEY
jgi:CBS domain-containing protein